jgi:hypothetical protein
MAQVSGKFVRISSGTREAEKSKGEVEAELPS